jgi:hypothetical protein
MSIQKILFPTGRYTYIHAILDGLLIALFIVLSTLFLI